MERAAIKDGSYLHGHTYGNLTWGAFKNVIQISTLLFCIRVSEIEKEEVLPLDGIVKTGSQYME